MKRLTILTIIAMFAAGIAPVEAKTAAELEKEKAMAEPYANDYGSEKVDVSKYPKKAQQGYKLLLQKCAQCHSAARPLNSQFTETAGKKLSERQANLAKLKKSDPDMFAKKNKNVWQVEAKIWQRYVKRMMSKPGCEVSKADGKLIWAFLSHDSRVRKTGKNKAKWKKQREKMLADFKKKHPKRYKELYEHE
jgi:mono/diheme cytochrome c family protein